MKKDTESAPGASPAGSIAAPGYPRSRTLRRGLQLALAGLWVLDGLLKFQPFMYTKNFAPQTLGAAVDGAPFWLADPVDWAARILERHTVAPMLAFALIEIAIGVLMVYPRTARLGLLAGMGWVPFLWFFAEGLGGLTTGSASPLSGAPGASILYGLAAVLLWPARESTHKMTGLLKARTAKAVWTVLWALMAYLALQPANTAPDAISQTISGNAMGTPSWYTGLLNNATSWTHGRGGQLSIVLAIAFALIAICVWLPWTRAVRAGLVLAIVLAALIWVFGEGLGMPFTGTATDPDTGPLIALLALAFWPVGRSFPVVPAAVEPAAVQAVAPATA